MKITLIFGLLVTLFSFACPTEAIATEEERVDFSVQAELPENQINTEVSYFDLRVEPAQEQPLNVSVFNHSNEEITVEASIHNASTNSNGIIVYEEQETIDPSLNEPMTELVTLENETITVPAGGSETVTAMLNTPEDPFTGVKLGGLRFEKVDDENEEADGVTIQNRYSYVIGLQISENDEEVPSELNLQSVSPTLVNHRTAVVAGLQNSQPKLMNNVSINAQVYEENSSEAIREATQENINMAPNSTMDFIIDWDNQPLEAGNYQLDLVAREGENEWEWTEEFTIDEEQESLNEQAVELEEPQTSSVGYIAGILVLILIIAGLVVYIRKLKKEN